MSYLSCAMGFWYPVVFTTTEVVYVTVESPTFCLASYLTGVHFRNELYHVGHVGKQKIKCRPVRTREIAGFTF